MKFSGAVIVAGICLAGYAGFYYWITHPTPYKDCDSVQDFVAGKKYIYKRKACYIPRIVLDSLRELNQEDFRATVADSGEAVELTDALSGTDEKRSRFNFVFLDDSNCLVSYTCGGIAEHDIVDYFHYKGNFRHIRYQPRIAISDTAQLNIFLRNKDSLSYAGI